jgi:tRNA(fMet)-specific endonuclease VapC
LQQRLDAISPSDVWFCAVVKEELIYGAHRYENREARLSVLRELFARHASVPFDDAAAEEAGRLRSELEELGRAIGPHDLQIAGIALSRGWTLVTNNTDEFKRVSGLSIEDWTK